MPLVGIGLVGAGAYGEFCLAAFAGVPEVSIAAVCDYAETVERDHGRIEQRQCWVIADHAAQADGWVGCQTLVRLICQRELKGKAERETRYYISSLPPCASLLLSQ